MILKGSQRGGASDLAAHLEKPENDHVELHELRGFAADNLRGALNEMYAISRGTKCKKFMYSLSLNPPQDKTVPTAAFEAAIEKIEERLGLSGQSRAIVFHEKNGRRHAHCVWSRIETSEMKAINIAFDHKKLGQVSRELFLEHEWKMPSGLVSKDKRDPQNFNLAEWQQAKRIGSDPRSIKAALEDAWAVSDTRVAFEHALDERGFKLARGTRRGFVAVDMFGEIYSIPRQAGVKTKAVRSRLGDESELPSISNVKAEIAQNMQAKVSQLKSQLERKRVQSDDAYNSQHTALVKKQNQERGVLATKLQTRKHKETLERMGRFRKGVKGLWDRLNGTHSKTRTRNELEATEGALRDRAERDALIFRHLGQRQRLSLFREGYRRDYGRERLRLERDQARYEGPEFQ